RWSWPSCFAANMIRTTPPAGEAARHRSRHGATWALSWPARLADKIVYQLVSVRVILSAGRRVLLVARLSESGGARSRLGESGYASSASRSPTLRVGKSQIPTRRVGLRQQGFS